MNSTIRQTFGMRFAIMLLAFVTMAMLQGCHHHHQTSNSGSVNNNTPPADKPFTQLRQQFNSQVDIIAPANDGTGDVYVGGEFTVYDSTASNYIIRLHSDGSVDSAFNIGSGFDSSVSAIVPATDGSGDIYVGGFFTSYNGTASNGIIRLHSDGSVDTNFDIGSGISSYGYVSSIVPATDGSGNIYVAGGFSSFNGTNDSDIVRLHNDGSVDSNFNVGTGFDFSSFVTTMAEATDGSGDIYVGGSFTSYNGTNSHGIIRLNNDGSIDSTFNVGSGISSNGTVDTITPLTDGSGEVYVGGGFVSYNGTYRSDLIRLHSDGSIDTGFNFGPAGFTRDVYQVVAVNDGSGDIYAGGAFTSYNGLDNSHHLIRLHSDGSVNSDFNIGDGFDNTVYTIAQSTDGSGDIYVGGMFFSYNDKAGHSIVRLNSDGSADTGFTRSNGFDSGIDTIAPAADGSGDIYLGGLFNSYNGTASNRIIRLNKDGSIDSGFNIGTGFDSLVDIIAPANDGSGDIYVGGDFSSYNGTSSNGFLRLNQDGSIDSGFNIGSGFDGIVISVVPATDGTGDIYVGGHFAHYNGTASNNLVRLHSDGSVDTAFNVGTGFDSDVYIIAPATDGSGDIYVGGFFTSYNGTTSNNIIRLHSNGSVVSDFNVGTGFNGYVGSIAPATDGSGDVYVGGGFTSYNGTTSNKIIRLHSDGSINTDFNIGSGFDSDPYTIAPTTDGSGDMYIGGDFSSYNGTASHYLIRLNSDGSIDSGFNVNVGFNNDVVTIVPANNGFGDIYLGGVFSSYQTTTALGFIALKSDGSID